MMINRSTRRRLAAAVAVLGLSAGLTACGDNTDDTSTSQASSTETAANGDVFNKADVSFATDMIPHHAQAIEMVTLTEGRQLDPAVQQLADEIRNAQSPEVETMTGWLTSWGQEVPGTTSADSGNMSEMGDMPGMMSAEDMDALKNAPDDEFQTMWLEMMKQHHEGAVEMAKTEQENGAFPDAIKLADSIVTTQEAEIKEIDQLLGS